MFSFDYILFKFLYYFRAVLLISANIHGSDDRGRIIRRTLARYLLLLQALTCQAVSTSVRKRFPTLDHIEEAGLMTKEERIAYDEVPGIHGKWWVPAQWFTSLVVRARKEGRIKDDILLHQILEVIDTITDHHFFAKSSRCFIFCFTSRNYMFSEVAVE